MRLFTVAAMLSACFAIGSPGWCQVGRYRLTGSPDAASELVIKPDHSFLYGLSEGALDEWAKGRWEAAPGGVLLTTVPAPAPTRFVQASAGRSGEWALELRVERSGRGIAGVHFVVGLADGTEVRDYTQEDGWRLPNGGGRPVWVRFEIPMYELQSPRFPIDASDANALRFQIVGDDLGTVGFTQEHVAIHGREAVMRRRGEDLRYTRLP